MITEKNIKIRIESHRTPKHNNIFVEFNLINELNENEIELKLKLLDGKITDSQLTSKNANISVLNLCSEFIEKLSVLKFD
jgi:hypothetical protein